MARQSEYQQMYELIEEWKENCLLDGKGLIWSDENIWTKETFARFRHMFIDQPDVSSASFYEKLEDQLKGEHETVYKYTIELLFLYYIVPARTTYKTKMNKLEMIANWADIEINRSLPVFDVLKEGIAATGASYNTRMYFEIYMLHLFAEKLHKLSLAERKNILNDPKLFKQFVTKARKEVGTRVQTQHMLQHLLLPDYFERIANWGHKEKVVETFADLLDDTDTEDIDEQIYHIKQKLRAEYPNENIDFYKTPFIEEQWNADRSKPNYFLLVADPGKWSFEQIKDGSTEFFTVHNKAGNLRRNPNAYRTAKAGDHVIFYESGSSRRVVGHGKIDRGIHENVVGEEVITFYFIEELSPISWSDISKHPILKDSDVVRSGNRGSLHQLTKKEYETIIQWKDEPLVVKETAKALEQSISIPEVSFDVAFDSNELGLVFENEDILIDQITTAMATGDHIIFTGPPGTGKSKLAERICDMYGVQSKMVTASANWSTYETIGGYRPDQTGQLYFDPGIFLQCIKDEETKQPKNDWLIIDEINRADIDKAFGSLFSVLTGDTVQLPFQAPSGERIQLKQQGDIHATVASDHTYIFPKDWRIIGTMNTVDKASLFEMSYAFMRRFSFIPVGIPRNINETLIKHYLQIWGLTDYSFVTELKDIWQLINEYRKLGPAIIEDIARYTLQSDDFMSAIILHVLPQFEGLAQPEIEAFANRLASMENIIPDRSMLDDFIEDFFHLGDF